MKIVEVKSIVETYNHTMELAKEYIYAELGKKEDVSNLEIENIKIKTDTDKIVASLWRKVTPGNLVYVGSLQYPLKKFVTYCNKKQ